ncbi:MAG: hypothetical protein P4N41_17320 [Negativicutes bacterium]|nr:hypothetical protein [Negativicutes bacterium]
MMKRFSRILAVALLVLALYPSCPAAAADQPAPLVRIKGKVWYVSPPMDLYGIMSEDGKKFHPIRKLPREYQHDGIEVVVEGKIRDDLVGARMWGQPFEVVKITRTEQYIAPEDREAFRLLQMRMDAFNNKNLSQLQSIDTMAQGLSPDQFTGWLAGFDKFTLHYFETTAAAKPVIMDSTITGMCLFSRERLSSIALSGNFQYALMKFTMIKTAQGWKFSETGNYVPDDDVDMDQYVADLLAKAKLKYGSDNLTGWKG